jgi:hypothetical protein
MQQAAYQHPDLCLIPFLKLVNGFRGGMRILQNS